MNDKKSKSPKTVKKERKTQEKQVRKEQQLQKRAALAVERSKKKAEHAARLNDRHEAYAMRRDGLLRAARVLLWCMIGFIFLRGVIVCIRPDPISQVNRTISNFKMELTGIKEEDTEIFSFAENFAVNFMTYSPGQEAEYTNRLKAYAAPSVTSASYSFTGRGARVLYAQAYRKEAYSSKQTDVYVLLDVEYTTRVADERGNAQEEVTTAPTILKVPVYHYKNSYLIETTPTFVNDDRKATNYSVESFNGTVCNEVITATVKASLENFFKAYCESPQGVIDYYLDPQADPAQFIGLAGRVAFKDIFSIQVYSTAHEQEFLATVTVNVTDKNGAVLPQNYHLQIVYRDKQYYVRTMKVRNTNI